MKRTELNSQASNYLKAELARNGVGYIQLTEKLRAIGADETYQAVSAKINRGTFSFAFFMQCMKALQIETIKLR